MGPEKFMEYLTANFNMTRAESALIRNILYYALVYCQDDQEAHEFLKEMLDWTIGINDKEIEMFSIFN